MIRTAFLAAALVAAFPAVAAERAPAASKPVDCLVTRNIQQSQAGPDRKWYVRLRDRTWWRNTMECPGLSPRRALVHTSPIGNQCRGDIVQVVDFTMGGVSFGGCGLGSWEQVDGPPAKGKAAKPKG
ncbi:hypothetical protein [Sandarakinorhabdus sp. AAP62]|uniref:hypothetical protein n=1 Tax=Sandarakinorhabdus sp. AAP62 TaxID=1248916 RepID=UPI0012673644|nr:hypothetical protein [Sandarakinorhabdus sp. AAP62]